MIAFSGFFNSWLILARNSDFANRARWASAGRVAELALRRLMALDLLLELALGVDDARK